MIINLQDEIAVDLPRIREYVRLLKRLLQLQERDFNVCFVDDSRIRKLNAAYRGKPYPTDVLSFPLNGHSLNGSKHNASRSDPLEESIAAASAELEGFLGDIVISTPAARRNARADAHSVPNEIRWLILHGVLHLLGYDHETDQGQMATREIELRQKLALARIRRRRSRTRHSRSRLGRLLGASDLG